MNLSVIVPTYKRTNDLRRLLDSLFQQTVPVAQVLVVVGPGDEESMALAREWQAGQPALTVLPATRRSVVHALNLGLARVTGDIVCLLDDDVWLPAEWAARIAGAFRADAGLGAYGGRDRLQVNDPKLANPPLASAIGRFRWDGALNGGHHCGSTVSPVHVDVLKGCNLSFRQAAFPAMEVDPGLESQGAEVCWEVDICQCIGRTGYGLLYDNDNYVLHYASARPADDDRGNMFLPAWAKRTFNEGLVTAKYRPLPELVLLGLRSFLVGTRMQPGLVWGALLLRKYPSWPVLKLPWHYAYAFCKGAAYGWRRRRALNTVGPAPSPSAEALASGHSKILIANQFKTNGITGQELLRNDR